MAKWSTLDANSRKSLLARVSAIELRRDLEDTEGLAHLPLLVYVEEDVLYIAFLVWNHLDAEEVPNAKDSDGFHVLSHEAGCAFIAADILFLAVSSSMPTPM